MRNVFDLMTGQELNEEELRQLKQVYAKPANVTLSEELLDSYEASRASWALQAKEDEDFRNGAQWTEKAKTTLRKRKQSPVVVNVIKPTVETGKALLTSNRPRFTSSAQEDSDVRVGKMFSELMSRIWTISDGDVQHKQVIDDYYVKGMGVWFVDYDPQADFGKGEIFVRSLDPFDVYIDPNAQDIFARDAAHILIHRTLTAEQIQRWLPDAKRILALATEDSRNRRPGSMRSGSEGQTDQVLDQYHRHYSAIDRFSKIKIRYVRIEKLPDNTEKMLVESEAKKYFAQPAVIEQGAKGTRYVTEADEVQEALRRFQETGGTYHFIQDPISGSPVMQPGPATEQAIPESEVVMQVTTNAELLKQGIFEVYPYVEDRIQRTLSVGGVLVWEGILPIADYPIIPVMNHFTRNPYPMSDVRFVRPIQELINKIRSLILTHAANSANVRVFVPEGTNKTRVEEAFRKPGVAVETYNPELGAPVIAQTYPIAPELFKDEQDAKQDIERIFGVYEFMQGNIEKAPETYKGTVALDEYSQRRIRSKQADIEAALNVMARVVVDMIQAYYTEHKVIRILEPNHPPRQLEINVPIYDDLGQEITGRVNDVTVGHYDIVLVSGSMLPNNRWARFDYYMQLYQAGLIDQVEVLKQTEVVDMEGVLNRHNRELKLQQALMQAQEQIKQLRGDLQTAQRESVQDRKRVEVEKFKGRLNETGSDIKAASKVFQLRLGDELGRVQQANDEVIAEQQDAALPE